MRCDICHKLPKCPPEAHWNLRYWLYYDIDGEPKLSETGRKKLGEHYIENLREKTRIANRIQQHPRRDK
jgi:hypothetical protein